ncbi:MAG: hypothetical protein AAF997_21950 [Myxococcota bacterium]
MWALAACENEAPRRQHIEIAPADRSCTEGETCAVVETSCVSIGCGCGVAVNEKRLLDYQRELAECRGAEPVTTCEGGCKTPFAKCFNGACVLTDEPPILVRRGQDVSRLCERTGGRYVGCPDCPPSERCKSCRPCECPSSDKWTRKGCRRMVKVEPRDILVEVRPKRTSLSRPLKVRVHNESRRPIWLKSVCGTPFYQARREEDQWEVRYQLVPDGRCKNGRVEIGPGKKRPFVVKSLDKLAAPNGSLINGGTLRYELTYSDDPESFAHFDEVYSAEFEAESKRSRK